MRIGIIGTGSVGRSLAARLSRNGHQVLVANSRGPAAVQESLAAGRNSVSTPASTADVMGCEIVFLAVPWTKIRDVLASGGPRDGRILVDTTNIFLTYPPNARVDDLKGDSGSEIVARLASDARVVKAFNTLAFARMFEPVPKATKRVLFVAGDDVPAVTTVASLVSELGLHPVPLGSLATAGREMELGGPLSGLELLTPTKGVA